MSQPVPAPPHQVVSAPAPRPERPLGPAVVWTAVLNLVAVVLAGAFVAMIGLLLVDVANRTGREVFSGPVGVDMPRLTVLFLVVAAVAWLAGVALTVGTLVLLRLAGQFRVMPSFVQALLAWLVMLVAAGVVLPLLSSLGQLLWWPLTGLGG
jgi:hypothetical protein